MAHTLQIILCLVVMSRLGAAKDLGWMKAAPDNLFMSPSVRATCFARTMTQVLQYNVEMKKTVAETISHLQPYSHTWWTALTFLYESSIMSERVRNDAAYMLASAYEVNGCDAQGRLLPLHVRYDRALSILIERYDPWYLPMRLTCHSVAHQVLQRDIRQLLERFARFSNPHAPSLSYEHQRILFIFENKELTAEVARAVFELLKAFSSQSET